VNGMTPWEYSAAITGWAKANGIGDAENKNSYPTDDEFADWLAKAA
jgi:hypothetical protein